MQLPVFVLLTVGGVMYRAHEIGDWRVMFLAPLILFLATPFLAK